MKFKAKVLKRFPEAKPSVIDRWPDGAPRRVVVLVADRELCTGDNYGYDQTHKQAWRDAYFWCVRNPAAEAA